MGLLSRWFEGTAFESKGLKKVALKGNRRVWSKCLARAYHSVLLVACQLRLGFGAIADEVRRSS